MDKVSSFSERIVKRVPDLVQECFTNLQNDSVITGIGFVYGFTTDTNVKNVLRAPNTNLILAALYGSVTAFGSSYAASLMPSYFKPIVPISLIASGIYYKFRKSTKPTQAYTMKDFMRDFKEVFGTPDIAVSETANAVADASQEQPADTEIIIEDQ